MSELHEVRVGTLTPAMAPPPAGAVICGTCGGETDGTPAASCQSCGAPLRVLEPLVVGCGWCGRENHRDQTAHCLGCGGPLPPLPGGNPGPRPPPVPRVLPQDFVRRTRFTKNTLVLIGAIFVFLFFWTGIFFVIGAALLYFGNRRAMDQLKALTDGAATRGRLTGVSVNPSESINGRHPWLVRWTFDRPDGSTATGACRAWDPVTAKRQPGDAVWVVAGQRDDRVVSAVWPPLR